jgi:hypothetical protein
MAVSQPSGSDAEKFEWILQNLTLFKVQFFFAFLISPAIIYLMISQLKAYGIPEKDFSIPAIIFLGGYCVLSSVSYGAQFAYVPFLLKNNSIGIARLFYFNSTGSFTYFLNQMGYLFWAVGALILFSGFIFKAAKLKVISIIYMFSAFLSIIAFLGLILNNDLLNSLTILSGIVLLPVGIISIIWSLKLIKR